MWGGLWHGAPYVCFALEGRIIQGFGSVGVEMRGRCGDGGIGLLALNSHLCETSKSNNKEKS